MHNYNAGTLPSRLEGPKLTLRNLVANEDKLKETKKITNIQQCVVCFNVYISMMAIRHVQDLLVYSSIITKASLDYVGIPWLLYNAHFCRAAAAAKCTNWAQVDAPMWTMYFTS